MRPKPIVLFILLGLGTCNSFSQEPAPSDSFINISRQKAISQFDRFILKQSGLYNGMEEIGYPSSYDGSPYFATEDWLKGSVLYNGRWYRNIPMRYDLAAGKVIILHFNQVFRLSLIKEKVEAFSMAGHNFVHLTDTTHGIPDEFYDLLYEGKMSVLVWRSRPIKEEIDRDHIRRWFDEEVRSFYILKNNRFYPIRNKRVFFHFFGDQKNEIRKYLRKEKIKYRKATEIAIVESVKYYEGLKH